MSFKVQTYWTDRKSPNSQWVEWNKGDVKPDLSGYDIFSFEADGHELSSLTISFHNLTYRVGRTIWKKDMAQFMFDNL